MTDTRSPVLELSTVVKPAKMFTIDGSEYDLLSLDHLSATQEAQVVALFNRHERITAALAEEKNHDRATALALKMRDVRIAVLALMTSAPASVLRELPMTAQTTLMVGIQKEVEANAQTAPADEDEVPEGTEDDGDDV